MKCELCGIDLEHNVPLDHPKHIFNKPVRKDGKLTWLKTCRDCFNKDTSDNDI